MNRPLWKELRREYEAKGEKLVAAAMGAQRADPPGGLQPLVRG